MEAKNKTDTGWMVVAYDETLREWAYGFLPTYGGEPRWFESVVEAKKWIDELDSNPCGAYKMPKIIVPWDNGGDY